MSADDASDETGDDGGEPTMVPVYLRRVVVRERADRQYIYLMEEDGERKFSIVIGSNEAWEIHRVLHAEETVRPLTHKLAYNLVRALDADIRSVDIVKLSENTFHAQIVLENKRGDTLAVVDARPSDAIALALRAGCPLRAAESVIEQAQSDGPE